MKISKLRGAMCLALTLGVAVCGLAFHSGAGSLSAFGFDAVAAVCPVGLLESMLGAKSVGLHGLICLAIALGIIVLVGKAFCAWACPIPWLQRFFRRSPESDGGCDVGAEAVSNSETGDGGEVVDDVVSGDAAAVILAADVGGADAAAAVPAGKTSALQGDAALAPVGGARDGVQHDTRHAVLAGALASSALFGFPVFCLVCPVGLSFATLAAVWHLLQFNETTWGLVAFPLVLALEVVFLRKWCFKFCPISALVSLVSRANRTFKPRVNEKECLRFCGVDCRACVKSCPERLDPHTLAIPECSKCGKCVDRCPAHAIHWEVTPRK